MGPMNQRFLSAALAACAALALSTVAACGSDLGDVDTAQLECVGNCEVALPAPNPSQLSRTAFVRLTNNGGAPARITGLSVAESSPFVGFDDEFRRRVLNSTLQPDGEAWDPVLNDNNNITSFDPNGIAFVIEPGATLQIDLRVTLQRGGSLNPECPNGQADCGTLRIETRNSGVSGDGIIRVPIRVAGDGGQLAVDPTQLVFSDGVANVPQTTEFVIQNIGTGPVFLEEVRLGAPDENVTIRETSNISLPITMTAGARFTYRVTWTPRAGELSISNSIVIRSDDAINPTINVGVSSTGDAAPAVEVTDEAETPLRQLDFPPLEDGRSSVPFNVRNTGSATLTFSYSFFNLIPEDARQSLRIEDADGLSVGSAQQTLNPGQTRGYRLVFQPGAGGSPAVNGLMRMTTNDPVRTRVEIPFSAGEAVPLFDLSDTDLRWGQIENNTPSPREFLVFNNGRGNLEVTGMEITGTHAALFSVSPEAPLTVGPRSSEIITVVYERESAPTLENHQATLTLTTTDEARPTATVNLVGISTQAGVTLPPTCVINASGSEPYAVGGTVTLDAGGSSSNNDPPDLNLSQSAWFATRPDGSRATLSAERGQTVSLAFDSAGTWTVFLTVVEREAETRCQRTLFVE